jgi:hypothetical protein
MTNRRLQRQCQIMAATRTIFNTGSAAIGGLYLVTHSLTVTLIGTAGLTALTGWALWLLQISADCPILHGGTNPRPGRGSGPSPHRRAPASHFHAAQPSSDEMANIVSEISSTGIVEDQARPTIPGRVR